MKPLFTDEELNLAKSQDKLLFECYNCQSNFFAMKKSYIFESKHSDRGRVRFCSQKCNQEFNHPKTRVKLSCEQCEKEFYKIPAEIKKTKHNFCCQSCFGTYNNMHRKFGYNRSKLEIWLEQKIKNVFKNTQVLFNDSETIELELDIYFPSLKIAFELNGITHYKPIYGDERFEKIKNNDNIKIKNCLKNEIKLYIIDVTKESRFSELKSEKYFDVIKNIINVSHLNLDVQQSLRASH